MNSFVQTFQTFAFPAVSLAASALLVSCGRSSTYVAPPPAPVAPEVLDPSLVPTDPAQPAPFALGENEQLIDYKVKKGDSLWAIGNVYGVKSSRIRAANGMTSDMIRYGETIKVPTKKTSVSAPPAPAPPAPAPRVPAAAPTASAPVVTPPVPVSAIQPRVSTPEPEPISGPVTGPITGPVEISD